MTKNFDSIVKKLSEDFSIAPQSRVPGTYNGKNIDWGKTATHPSGFKGDSFNTSSAQIVFQLPVKKKKKKSLNVRKKRVTTNRVGR